MLAASGHEAQHLLDIGLLQASDGAIWDYALKNEAVILTKDEDFAIRASVSRQVASVVWVRIGNCPNSKILDWFGRNLQLVLQALESGNRLVEIAG